MLPVFRYHPDPIASGSVVPSEAKCRCCKKARGYIYAGPVYAEDELEDALCPWCIAEGAAAKKFDATFVDSEAFGDGVSDEVIDTIAERTPGFNSWQSERWPDCCKDATAFIAPVGIQELRTSQYREYEFSVMGHIVYEMQISGGAATRLLDSLNRDQGPTAFLFRCLHCEMLHVYIDRT